MNRHISGREATYMAIESDKRGPVKLEPLPEGDAADATPVATGPSPPALANNEATTVQSSVPRRKPPRVRKQSPFNNQCVAPGLSGKLGDDGVR